VAKPLGLLKSRVALLPQAFRRAAEDLELGAERLAVLLGLLQSRRQPVLHALVVGDRPIFLLMPARGFRERLSLVLPLRDEFLPFGRPEATRGFELVEMVELGRFEPGVRLVESLLDLSQLRLEVHDFFEDGPLTLGIVSNILLARRHQLPGGSPDPLQVRRTRGELVLERLDDRGKLGDLGADGLKFALGEVRRLDVIGGMGGQAILIRRFFARLGMDRRCGPGRCVLVCGRDRDKLGGGDGRHLDFGPEWVVAVVADNPAAEIFHPDSERARAIRARNANVSGHGLDGSDRQGIGWRPRSSRCFLNSRLRNVTTASSDRIKPAGRSSEPAVQTKGEDRVDFSRR
jgi:hypothetical protein